MNILEFQDTPELCGDSFQGESWEAWRAVLSGAFALPMDDDRLALFKRLAGDREPPKERVRELWVIAGRRSAKTEQAASMAVYLGTVGAAVNGLTDRLSPGERGVIAIVAVDRAQAKVALGYVRGLLESSPVLKGMIERTTTESVELNNRVTIEVHTNSFRAIRGRTLLAVILDECAFFRSDASASPDVETYRAAVPGLATTGGLMIGISSPYSRKGLLFSKWAKHYGKDGDILVVQGRTEDFNPTIDRRVIEDALADDYESSKSEWLGEWRSDIAGYVDRAVIESLVRSEPLQLPPQPMHKYHAFVDGAAGGQDEFTLAIAHREDNHVIIDLLEGRHGQPAELTAAYAQIVKSYGLREVTGDRFSGAWIRDEFQKHGVTYRICDKTKTELYGEALPVINTGRIELPPDQRMINQITALERRTTRNGRDIIDHPAGPGAHDDRANAVAGAAWIARNRVMIRPGSLKVRFAGREYTT